MQERIWNRVGNGDRNKNNEGLDTYGSGYERGGCKEERLVLPGRMKAQMCGCIQVTIIVDGRVLVCLKMRRWVKRENMMFVIKFVSKYLAIKRPAKCVRQHADEQ